MKQGIVFGNLSFILFCYLTLTLIFQKLGFLKHSPFITTYFCAYRTIPGSFYSLFLSYRHLNYYFLFLVFLLPFFCVCIHFFFSFFSTFFHVIFANIPSKFGFSFRPFFFLSANSISISPLSLNSFFFAFRFTFYIIFSFCLYFFLIISFEGYFPRAIFVLFFCFLV